ncbi:MAG: manganese efflux pump [Chloroflexi bacterium]|nr:manganese efflux pump [Chloroflexota bacterium]
MDLISILLIAIGLSADCFAVAVSGSVTLRTLSFIKVFRTAFTFGFFQGMMPVIGWLAGRTIAGIISAYDHWVAFSLLALVGGHMIWESFRREKGKGEVTDISRGVLLLVLAVATSIDALAVGLSLAFLENGIVQASIIIGLVTLLVTAGGFWIGRKAGGLRGKRAKLVGGIVLIGIGTRILLSHLLG